MKYLSDLGITTVEDPTTLTSLANAHFTASYEAAESFSYSVQIGNKGTWSSADVCIKDAIPPEPVNHKGALLWEETFDTYQSLHDHEGQWKDVNLSDPNARDDGHQWATGGVLGTPDGWQSVNGELVKGNAFPGSIASTSGDYWLDTQNSSGGINITNYFHDTIDDGKFFVSFDIGLHDFGTGVMEETPHDGSFEVRINGTAVATITYDELLAKGNASAQSGNTDEMFHYEIEVTNAVSPGLGNHNISLVDTTVSQGNFVGFAVDSIQINDWVV